MKWMISRGRLDGLPGDIDGDQDPLPLQPLHGESILVISSFPLENHAPGGRLEHDRRASELVEGEDSAPFRRVPEGAIALANTGRMRPSEVFTGCLERSKSFFHAELAKSTCALVQYRVGTDDSKMIVDSFTPVVS